MLLGVVSDTHGNLANTLTAVRQLEELQVNAVLHCGDIVSPSIIPLFSGWPAHFVFGNCDSEVEILRQTIREAGQTCHERFGDVQLGDRRIAMVHGDDSHRLEAAIASGDFDLICYGHTHRPETHLSGRTVVPIPARCIGPTRTRLRSWT
jgi:putative phosphoesterase